MKQTHSTSDLNSKNLDDNFEDFMNSTNEIIPDSSSKKNRRMRHNVPSLSPHRHPRHTNMPFGAREVPRMRKSLNMRMMPDSASQNHSQIYKDSDSGRVFLNRSQNKQELQSQQSNKINMKPQKSESMSHTNSHRNIETHTHRPTRNKNIRVEELEDNTLAEEGTDRENQRVEGLRTPSRMQSRHFSRKNSDLNLPKKSGSGVSRVKASERELKRISSKKRYSYSIQIQKNEKIKQLQNKVNMQMSKLKTKKTAAKKLKNTIEDLKNKNAQLWTEKNKLSELYNQIINEKKNVNEWGKLMKGRSGKSKTHKENGTNEFGHK